MCFKETRVTGRVESNKIANTHTHVAQPCRRDIGQKRQISWRRAPYTLSCTARSRRPTHMTVPTNHKLAYLHRARASPTQKQTWSGALVELSRWYRPLINWFTFEDRSYLEGALNARNTLYLHPVWFIMVGETCQRTIVSIRLFSTKHLCVPCSCSWTTRSGPAATTHQPHASNVAELYLLFPPPVCPFPPYPPTTFLRRMYKGYTEN